MKEEKAQCVITDADSQYNWPWLNIPIIQIKTGTMTASCCQKMSAIGKKIFFIVDRNLGM